jgi:gliding motility-associated protein GldM
MSLPKEPRQKMINIMYLFLTAMLALNISAEILNAFKTVNRSLENTNATVNASTTSILKSLQEKTTKEETKERALKWYPKAEQVVATSQSLYAYIETLKGKILTLAGGKPGDSNGKFDEGNQSHVTKLMITDGEAKKLFDMLSKYKADILKIDPAIDSAFKTSLQIDLSNPPGQDGKVKPWEIAYFNMVPTVAGLTILSKFQNDIKTAENKVVTFCHEQVGRVDVVFDSYAAIVGQNSNYLMPGQEIEIKAGVGAFSKAAQPTISIGGSSVAIGEEGYALYKGAAGGVGSHTIPVKISFMNQQTGQMDTREVNVEYTVGSANASIALDKMNVLYIGVDNPVTIAASGGGDDKVNATINNGSLTRVGPGKYIARVSAINDNTLITVSVDGKVAGTSQFRVRTIPEAQAYVGGKPSGENYSASALNAQAGVGAGIKNFPFELEYDVVSFTFTTDTDDDIVSIPNQGAAFTGAVKNAMKAHLRSGVDRTVTFDDIRVKGPDGRTTKAPSLVYYVR